jgi:hypothetical protein
LVTQPLSTVHIDIVGPFPNTNGMTNLLTMVDRFSRFCWIAPIADASADSVTRVLFDWWTQFGFPTNVVTDNGPAFIAYSFRQLAQLARVRHISTCAYSPASNGLVERLHRDLAHFLRAHRHEWPTAAKFFMLARNSAPHSSLGGLSPAEVMFNRDLSTPVRPLVRSPYPDPWHTVWDQAREATLKAFHNAKKYHDRIFHHLEFEVGDDVLLWTPPTSKLDLPFSGPHRVIKKISPLVYVLAGQRNPIHVRRLRPYTGPRPGTEMNHAIEEYLRDVAQHAAAQEPFEGAVDQEDAHEAQDDPDDDSSREEEEKTDEEERDSGPDPLPGSQAVEDYTNPDSNFDQNTDVDGKDPLQFSSVSKGAPGDEDNCHDVTSEAVDCPENQGPPEPDHAQPQATASKVPPACPAAAGDLPDDDPPHAGDAASSARVLFRRRKGAQLRYRIQLGSGTIVWLTRAQLRSDPALSRLVADYEAAHGRGRRAPKGG